MWIAADGTPLLANRNGTVFTDEFTEATPAVKKLKRNSAHLRHLNDRYRDWVDETGIHNRSTRVPEAW